MKTAKTKIDCGKDTLSMKVEDERIEFNSHDTMKYLTTMFILSYILNRLISVCNKFFILIVRMD